MNFLLPIVFTALLVLAACGQTGQLVLPPEVSDNKTDEKPTPKPAQ